ncbi:MAG: class IV adenylate cyclase [Alphaproteobacteria bacterium]|nr:MAG: hypothetical protein B6I23_00460 [Rickettsiaceae bacterium 4572_127]
MKDLEIEITIKLKDKKLLLSYLSANGKFLGEKKQTDVYFDPPHKTFLFDTKDGLDAKEFIRVRFSEKGDSITYKNWHKETPEMPAYADEYESNLSDGKSTEKIFRTLGFKETAKVEKTRRSYSCGELLVEFDNVVGLGDFVEIEYNSSSAKSPREAFDLIDNFLKNAGITVFEHVKTGYVQLLWRKNARK